MPVSPLGNQIFINQNMSVASHTQAQHQGKIDFQTVLNVQEFQDKEKKVEETRPAEENEKIDPDREHEKKRQEQELENMEEQQKKRDDDEEESEGSNPLHHLLDIKI